LKITVTAEEPKDDQLAAKVTVATKDVNAAVDKAYKDISHKYSFQGFRKGHTPRQVIDGIVGREAVLAEATNALINGAEPAMLEELDIVPVADIDYGEDPELVAEGKPYHIEASIKLRPTCELDSYDAPDIEMPPAEVTDAEVDEQIDVLQGYHATFEDVEEDRGIEADDIVQADVENVSGAEGFAGENRMFTLEQGAFPEEFDKQILGMKKGQTKEVSFTPEAPEGTEPTTITCKVAVKAIKRRVTPELDDEFVKKGYGFGSVDELRDAVKSEIEGDKKESLPGLKEDRVVEALASHLKLDEVPEDYLNQVFRELANNFLDQLQRQGMTLDAFLSARHIDAQTFMADLHQQAEERARQSLALDAIAKKLELEVTKDDIVDEFKAAGAPDVKAAMKNFMDEGRMPAIRDSIKRTKAVNWLVENAKVTEVDEIAKKRADEAKAKPAAKKATKKAAAKKPAADKADDKKPAAKKTATKKPAAKKAAAPKADKTADAE
jgi:trigger factor